MRILYVSGRGATDLSDLLGRNGAVCDVIGVRELPSQTGEGYDAYIFDGTGTEGGLLFRPRERIVADILAESGKPVLCVMCPYIMTVCCQPPVRTRFSRPVVTPELEADGLSAGDILDEQCNDRISCYTTSSESKPLLYYVNNPRGFYSTKLPESLRFSEAALWYERESVMFCAFGLTSFASARFAPKKKWYSLISFICGKLFGTQISEESFDRLYAEKGYYTVREDKALDELLSESVRRAVDWHFAAGTVLEDEGGIYAMSEGLSAEIRPDGSQTKNRNTTVDSTGETSMLFALDDMYLRLYENTDGGKEKYTKAFRDYVLSHIRDYGGSFKGYGSSGDGAWWNACYGDDASRGIIMPELVSALTGFCGSGDGAWWNGGYGDGVSKGAIFPELFASLSGEKAAGLDKALTCLDFLVRTTGSDGLRFCRTDIVDREKETLSLFSLDYKNDKWNWGSAGVKPASELPLIEAKTPSAHYNGYYLATLLLAYKITGRELYRDTAVRGLTTIMEKYYPVTAREHSETEELCRLVLPLAYLYWATHEEKHLGWLNTVIASLEEKRRPDGSFIEWDTGYKACCAGTAGTECSVLAENGNPVVDLLYSLNWLPFSLSQAYFITGDEHIAELFEGVARFLVSIQIHSADKTIDGAWARAFDTSSYEVYGVPNDVGWAPWSVETGWTMAQIPSGFLLWLMRDRFMKLFRG